MEKDKDIIFSLDKVGFNYGQGESIFEEISFKVHQGEKICLLGANGSGKSTLLKLMCGLSFATSGVFTAFEKEITEKELENDTFSQQYHQKVGFIFQNSDVQLFTTRVRDEIAFGPLQLGLSHKEVKQRVEDVLELLCIQHLRDKSPHRLSGGEKKKVALATVLVLDPKVLILDEPTNGLDPRTQRWLVNLLLQLNRRGRTIITSTHNLELAHTLADRALVLNEQHELVYDGASAEVLTNREILLQVNLIDEYCHLHGENAHIHRYTHD